MLHNLHVKNLALIDECEVEFEKGLNILSGETGAGKSIIIGSINMALGEKVSKEMLRDNEESAYVELVFGVEDQKTIDKLMELEVEVCDGCVVLSRKITSNRAVARINGEAASASKIKEVASLLIDIHGQHEHQSLLTKKNHLTILDDYADARLNEEKKILATKYKEYKLLKEEFDNSNIDTEARSRELSFLEYEVDEITKAELKIGEDEELESQYKLFSNGQKIMEALNTAYSLTGQEMGSASELIGKAAREIAMVSDFDGEIANLNEMISELDSLMSDFNHQISSYISNTEFDQEQFYEIEKRLDLINHLKSKYGHTIDEILKSLDEKSKRIEVLNDYDLYLSNLKKALDDKENELKSVSKRVSKIRKEESLNLVKEITIALKDLNFLDVVLEMRFEELSNYSSNGIDDVYFLISTNPGEPVKPLDKIASGGELSRIMLAIKTVMAENDRINTLIFDEIDSGISGRTAQMVSEKMNCVGENHQIICITHLPQIAAMADSHFLIEKEVLNSTTVSKISKLSKEDSVKELARMLGGVEITDTVLQSAKEMKDLASMKK